MESTLKLIKVILDLIKYLAKSIGLPDWIVNEINLMIIFLGLLYLLVYMGWKGFGKFMLWKNQRLLNRDLKSHHYTEADVDRATRYYIPTKYQNVAPSEDDEPGRKYIAVPKGKLISLFMKKVFHGKKEHNNYFLVLADSGMGKTTFMINLYLAYKNMRKPFSKKYAIELFPLGHKKTLERVAKIENKADTILLLDAFDEDVKALENYEIRFKEIIDLAEEFREIIITCRTQFFPSKKEEPHETGYISFGETNEEVKFQKLYLSVFDDKDITRYLRKRFRWYQRGKLKRANEIAKKSPNLVVRPMLLSHIEDLVDSDREYEFTFQIYEELIKQWIERESSKPAIKQKYEQKAYKEKLGAFSLQLAVNLYKNREERGGYFIRQEELKKGIETDLNGDDFSMRESDKRSRSLLNRDAEGRYKFSHKSILEYFLAKEFFRNPDFYLEFDFEGMDTAKLFFDEMLVFWLRTTEGGYSQTNVSRLSFTKSLKDLKFTGREFEKGTKESIVGVVGIKIKNPEYLKLLAGTPCIELVSFKGMKKSLMENPYFLFICLLRLDYSKRYNRFKNAPEALRKEILDMIKKDMGKSKFNRVLKKRRAKLNKLEVPDLLEEFDRYESEILFRPKIVSKSLIDLLFLIERLDRLPELDRLFTELNQEAILSAFKMVFSAPKDIEFHDIYNEKNESFKGRITSMVYFLAFEGLDLPSLRNFYGNLIQREAEQIMGINEAYHHLKIMNTLNTKKMNCIVNMVLSS